MKKGKRTRGPIFYMGIDPGKSGGVALIHKRKDQVIPFVMPLGHLGLWTVIRAYAPEIICAVVEKPAPGFPGSGKSSVAKLYGQWSACCMALTAAEIPYECIAPAAWMRGLSIPSKKPGMGRDAWKERSR